jgi:hypothetical protein
MAEVVAVLQKQELRRNIVSEAGGEDAADVEEQAAAATEDPVEKTPAPLVTPAKKSSPKAKSSTPKMPPKKKDDSATSPAPTKKQTPKPKPAEEEPAVVAPAKSKDKRSAPPAEEAPSKRIKSSTPKSSGGNANGKATYGQQITCFNVRKLKEKEIGIPEKLKPRFYARQDSIRELFSGMSTFKAWLDTVASWVKQSEQHADELDMAALALEFICQKEELTQLQFGLIEARCASVKNAKTAESRVAATQVATKVLLTHQPTVDHLQQLFEQETNFVDFLHSSVGSDVMLGEPFLSVLNLSRFKQLPEGDETEYIKTLTPLLPLAFSTLLVCEELYRKPKGAAEEPEPQAEEEEEPEFTLL